MLELLEQVEKGEAANDYQVTLATAPDEVVAKVVSGELDIAAVPTNVAATLYNKTQGGVQLAALNTMVSLLVPRLVFLLAFLLAVQPPVLLSTAVVFLPLRCSERRKSSKVPSPKQGLLPIIFSFSWIISSFPGKYLVLPSAG